MDKKTEYFVKKIEETIKNGQFIEAQSYYDKACSSVGEIPEIRIYKETIEEQTAIKAEEERKIKERKKSKSFLVTKLILTCGILFLLFFSFLMSELCIENDGFGAAVFVTSIILLIPCGIAYLVTTVKEIILKKKNMYIEVFHGEKSEKITKINTAVLASFTIAFYFFSFLNIGCGIGEYLAVFALCAMALMLLSIITDDWKQLFRSKAVISALALCIACIITSFRFEMKKLLIAGVLTIIGLTLQLILKKRFKKAIDKKYITQFSLSVFAAILCIVFCSISLTICANREAAIRGELKGKILAYTVSKSTYIKEDTDDTYDSYGYVFDENARYRSFNKDGKVNDRDYAVNIEFTWFGFGKAYWGVANRLIIFDENNHVVGVQESIYNSDLYEYYEVVDTIPTENDFNTDTNENKPTDTSEEEKKVGDTYIFGSYEQDNETAAKNPSDNSENTSTQPSESSTPPQPTNPCAQGHSWKEATCTEPATCMVCGATTGSALGHNYSAATCTPPQTCTTCGATNGSANGHDMDVTRCIICNYIGYDLIAKSYNNVRAFDITTQTNHTISNAAISSDGIMSFAFNGKRYSLKLVQTDMVTDKGWRVFDCYINGKMITDAEVHVSNLTYELEVAYIEGENF